MEQVVVKLIVHHNIIKMMKNILVILAIQAANNVQEDMHKIVQLVNQQELFINFCIWICVWKNVMQDITKIKLKEHVSYVLPN